MHVCIHVFMYSCIDAHKVIPYIRCVYQLLYCLMTQQFHKIGQAVGATNCYMNLCVYELMYLFIRLIVLQNRPSRRRRSRRSA